MDPNLKPDAGAAPEPNSTPSPGVSNDPADTTDYVAELLAWWNEERDRKNEMGDYAAKMGYGLKGFKAKALPLRPDGTVIRDEETQPPDTPTE